MAASTTRERLIQTAHDLFYAEGFHMVGLDRILSEVGVTKTTFYKHFQSKDDLVSESLKWHDKWWRDTFMALLRKHGGDTPRGQLESVFDAIDAVICGDDYNGCFFVNVAVQFPNPNDPANEAARVHKKAMEDIIRELAGYAGADDAAAFAQEFTMLMEGAYVTQQIQRAPGTCDVARRMAHMLIDRHLPSPAQSK